MANSRRLLAKTGICGRHVIMCGILILAMGVSTRCTENGASVYPWATFYSANEFVDGHAKSMTEEYLPMRSEHNMVGMCIFGAERSRATSPFP
jgi:hypothetical protein